VRVDKLLANMGFGSRKDVKQHIRKGRVAVNDAKVKNGKHAVNVEKDIVTFNGEVVHYQEFIYLMMHKPAGCISATFDHYEQTVVDLLEEDYQLFEPFPIGRLDKDTEGLLILSNDGQLAHRLTSPKHAVEKVYYAHIRGKVDEEDIEKMSAGVILDDGYVTRPAKLSIIKSDDISEIELTITEGKFHQVKRMFMSLNKEVIYLKRIRMGNLMLDPSLPLGETRELTEEEVDILQANE